MEQAKSIVMGCCVLTFSRSYFMFFLYIFSPVKSKKKKKKKELQKYVIWYGIGVILVEVLIETVNIFLVNCVDAIRHKNFLFAFFSSSCFRSPYYRTLEWNKYELCSLLSLINSLLLWKYDEFETKNYSNARSSMIGGR